MTETAKATKFVSKLRNLLADLTFTKRALTFQQQQLRPLRPATLSRAFRYIPFLVHRGCKEKTKKIS